MILAKSLNLIARVLRDIAAQYKILCINMVWHYSNGTKFPTFDTYPPATFKKFANHNHNCCHTRNIWQPGWMLIAQIYF